MSTFIEGARITSEGEGKRLIVLGDNQRVILASEDTGGRYALVESHNPTGVGIPLHLHHNEDKTLTKHSMCWKGRLSFRLG